MIYHDVKRTLMPQDNLAAQVDSELLIAVQTLAQREGRQLEALVEEALTDLIEKHKPPEPRPHVMTSYLASHEKYGPVYKKLAE
jgi:hypothetical protein